MFPRRFPSVCGVCFCLHGLSQRYCLTEKCVYIYTGIEQNEQNGIEAVGEAEQGR